jgi:hypothetical protein
MLQGEAKRIYQREYMRRRRSGQLMPPKPKPEWQPTQAMINQVAYWFRIQLGSRPYDLRSIGRQVVDGLAPSNEDGTANEAAWNEALRRYKSLLDEQRDARKRAKAERDAPPPPKCCSFCGEPQSARRVLVGTGGTFICAKCTKRVAAVFAKRRK